MLNNVREGRDYNADAVGMSEYGGAHGTLVSLIRRGLLEWRGDELVITAEGRATLQSSTET